MISAKEIALFTKSLVEGNEDAIISNVSKIEEAKKGDLAFMSNPKYEQYLYDTNASIVFIKQDFIVKKKTKCVLLRSTNPYYAFCLVLDKYFNPNIHPSGIEHNSFMHKSIISLDKDCYLGAFAYIGANAIIGKNVKIYPQVFIGENCTIGDNTILYPGVKIMPKCVVGQNCIIHANTVIGSDGFGFAPLPTGEYAKIPQVGNVIIENEVEIGANCAIDRATMGSTIIRKGVKLDNLIQIAHNVEVGKNTVIAAQTGISGSVKIGNQCIIGGQVGFVGHITVANGTQIGAQSGVQKEISVENQQFIGSPIMPLREAFKTQVLVRNLPNLNERIKKLEQQQNDK